MKGSWMNFKVGFMLNRGLKHEVNANECKHIRTWSGGVWESKGGISKTPKSTFTLEVGNLEMFWIGA